MIENLLGLKETSREDIIAILDDADRMKSEILMQDVKKSDILKAVSYTHLKRPLCCQGCGRRY